jgi:hypothetical protein
MPVAVVAAAYVGSQALKAKGARKGAKAQLKGIAAAKDDLNAGYDAAQEYQTPYVEAGKQTIGQLASGLQDGGEFNRSFSAADFEVDPGYQFRQDQGQKAVERSAAARGGALSGAAIKASNEHGQNLASQEYQSAYQRYNNDLNGRFARLSSVAQMGQHAADVSSSNETERGTNLGNLSINKGNVNAAKQIATYNAAANSLGAIANAYSGGVGGGGGGGSSISDYTGSQYQEWLKNGGGATSYGGR